MEFRQLDAESLPFEDGSFDLVISECLSAFSQPGKGIIGDGPGSSPGGFYRSAPWP